MIRNSMIALAALIALVLWIIDASRLDIAVCAFAYIWLIVLVFFIRYNRE
jgi:hypothetical protein